MKKEAVWAGVIAALPPLILAAAGWIEARTQKEAKFDALDSYREYIEETMQEDTGMKDSLDSCLRANEHLTEAIHGGGPVRECPPCPQLQPASDLGIAAEPAPEGP